MSAPVYRAHDERPVADRYESTLCMTVMALRQGLDTGTAGLLLEHVERELVTLRAQRARMGVEK